MLSSLGHSGDLGSNPGLVNSATSHASKFFFVKAHKIPWRFYSLKPGGFISVNFVQFVLNSINLETKQVELGRLCHSFRDFPPVRTHILGLLSFQRFLTWSKLRLGKLETQYLAYFILLGT